MSTFFVRIASYWAIVLTILVCIPLIGRDTAPAPYMESRKNPSVSSLSAASLLTNRFSVKIPEIYRPITKPAPVLLVQEIKSKQNKVVKQAITLTKNVKRTASIHIRKQQRITANEVDFFYSLPSPHTRERVVKAEAKTPVQYAQKFRGNISAYTNGVSETGKTSRHPDYGITASGHRTQAGVTVAAGRHIPYGTVLYIDGIGYRTVHDRGGAIKGNKIDVFMSDMKQVNTFGRRHLDVYVVKWGDGKRKRRS